MNTITVQGRRFQLASFGERIDGEIAAIVDRELSEPTQLAAVRLAIADLGYEALGSEDELRALLRELFVSGRLRMIEADVQADEPVAYKKDEVGASAGASAPAVAKPSFLESLRRRVLDFVTTPKKEAPPPPAPVETAKPQKYKLIELVEVVDRGTLGTVGGAAKGSALLPKHLDRTEKEGSAFKQFINLGKDVDGAAQRHPEHDRYIDLKARIEWTEGDKTLSLAGKNVKWKVTVTPHGSTGRPASFAVASEQPGIGGTNNTLESTTSTDAKGWASIRFHLSQYAGDEFTIEAALDTSDSNAVGGAALKAGPYVTWRKFWYQLTHRDGATVPAPARAVTAFEKVGAALVAADVVKFSKTSTPTPPDRTFYPEGMTTTGSSSTTEIALIGSENKAWFFTNLFKASAGQPVKGHLVVCDGQWDHKGESTLQRFEMKAKTQEVTIDLGGSWNAGILKPALKGNVLTSGTWEVDAAVIASYVGWTPASPLVEPPPSKNSGTLSDADVSIPLPRTGKNVITITLPADAPDPTKYKMWINVKVAWGKHYSGESAGPKMLIKINPSDLNDYNDTISHEFGHGFKQTPKKPDKRNSTSLTAHAKQYDETDGHGGSGPHCSTDVTTGAVSTDAPNGVYQNGTCTMYHASASTVTGKFCSTCEPHIRLQPLSSF